MASITGASGSIISSTEELGDLTFRGASTGLGAEFAAEGGCEKRQLSP